MSEVSIFGNLSYSSYSVSRKRRSMVSVSFPLSNEKKSHKYNFFPLALRHIFPPKQQYFLISPQQHRQPHRASGRSKASSRKSQLSQSERVAISDLSSWGSDDDDEQGSGKGRDFPSRTFRSVFKQFKQDFIIYREDGSRL